MPNPPKASDLSLAHLTVSSATPVELVRAAAIAGFKGVGLRITGFSPATDEPSIVGRPHAIRELGAVVRQEGISITSVCSYRLTCNVDINAYGPVFDACLEIGARTLLFTCFIDDKNLAVERFGKLAEDAQELGLRIGIEFLRTSSLRRIEDVESIRKSVSRPNVGHIVDALHLQRCGHTPSDLTTLDDGLVYGIQICDALSSRPAAGEEANEVRNRLEPGAGDLPLFDLLDVIGDHTWIEIEAPNASHECMTVQERASNAYRSGADLIAARQRTRELGGNFIDIAKSSR